mgnify:CR=1 FL=1
MCARPVGDWPPLRTVGGAVRPPAPSDHVHGLGRRRLWAAGTAGTLAGRRCLEADACEDARGLGRLGRGGGRLAGCSEPAAELGAELGGVGRSRGRGRSRSSASRSRW